MMPSGDNFGFPVKPQELIAFEAMLKAGAPAISETDLRTLRKTCVAIMKG